MHTANFNSSIFRKLLIDLFLIVSLDKIAYISDIHLIHKFTDCKSENDREAVIKKIAKLLDFSRNCFFLIGGDISSEFTYYKKSLIVYLE